MLLKRDGGATYHTSDLATLYSRDQDHADEVLYVVDARQEMHFKQVFQAAKTKGLVSNHLHLEHIKFGTINGADGRPFKTRSGDTVKLRDVVVMAIEAAQNRLAQGALLKDTDTDTDTDTELQNSIAHSVAIAAIKFGDLNNHRTSDYILNLDDFCAFEGKTGPYLLYAAVRIKSILKKAQERGLKGGPLQLTCSADQNLALELTKFPMTLSQVHDKKIPHLLCEYLFNLAQAFSGFYQQCNIVRQDDPVIQAGWLSLVELCLKTLSCGLDLLGIRIPEKM
jgi:arginyl-tRNA synthetase